MGTEFGGDKKAPMHSPLARLERRFIDANVGRFPRWIETYHLTMLTVPWTVGVVAAGWLADQGSPHWLWLSSLMLFLQWFTDAFERSLGKHRKTGLIKWGYYMDHFLDFLFISGVIVGYTFLLDGTAHTLMLLLVPIIGAFWVSAFLDFSVTNEFQITQFFTGPTELRIYFILLNTAIIIWGTSFLAVALPWAFGLITLLLIVTVWRSHRRIWEIDMSAKRNAEAADKP